MNIQFLGAEVPLTFIKNEEQAKYAIAKILDTTSPMAIDIETAPKAGYTMAQGGGLNPHLTDVCLLQIYTGTEIFVVQQGKFFLSVLQSLDKKAVIAHNAIFELKHLRQYEVDLDRIGCTMVLSYLYERATTSPAKDDEEDYDPEDDADPVFTGFSLRECAGRYLNMDLSKAEQTSDWRAELTDAQIQYACLDVLVCLEIAKRLAPRVFNTFKMKSLYELLKKMQHVVVDMEIAGMQLDQEAHQALVHQWEADLEKSKEQTFRYFKDVNLRSSKQMGEWLEKMYPHEVPTWPRTEKGALAFGKVALIDKSYLDPIKKLREFKHTAKRLDTYGYRLAQNHINPVTGRIHAGYRIGETRTGRMSSSNPNAQQYPRDAEFRKLFVPAKGNVLVVSDFSQIEVRVQAELSKDPFMRQVYAQGRDIYVELAKKITMKEVIDKNDRAIGKLLVLALGYGMGAKKLILYAKQGFDMVLDLETAYDYWNGYHETFRVYSNWCESVRASARQLGYVKTLTGKVRRLKEKEIYTRAPNTIVQGTSFELLADACINIRNQIKGRGTIIATIHDEVIVECPAEEGEAIKNTVTNEMSRAMKKMFPNASSFNVAEAHVGKSWFEAK